MLTQRVVTLLRANRLVGTLLGVALISLAIGYGARSVMGAGAPSHANASPPPPGLITAKVEKRQITARITGRAEISVSDQVEVRPSVPEGTLDAVVTGHIPQVGAAIRSGSVILEVSGRPIFALEGKLPTYRSMGPGSRGPDVRQLRTALNRLGFAAGSGKSDRYDSSLAAAVRELYSKAGYHEPAGELAQGANAVEDARDALVDARAAHEQARARATSTAASIREQQEEASRAVSRAQRDLDHAKAARRQSPAPSGAADVAAAEAALAEAREQHAAAERLDPSEPERELEAAARAVTRAERALAQAEQAGLTPMPASELVFVQGTPRTVDAVNVRLGARLGATQATGEETADAPAVVLSGRALAVTATVRQADAALLKAGGPALIHAPEGEIAGTVKAITSPGTDEPSQDAEPGERTAKRGAGQAEVTIALKEEAANLGEGAIGNHPVTFDVGTSASDSLVVPTAAVQATTENEAVIDIVDGALLPGQPAAQQPTRRLVIVPGVSADGLVEIKSANGSLEMGDLVVLGVAGSASGPGKTTEPESGGTA